MKILTIEDNPELSQDIGEYLKEGGYLCEQVQTYASAKEKISEFTYDCILLDIMLPDGNGLDLLHLIKEENIKSGILVISAKDSLEDKIKGLENGADDYITKPFHLPELNARLRAIHRRKNLEGNNLVVFNEMELNTDSFELKINQSLVELTRKEFDLLLYFVVNKNRILSRYAIASHLWGDEADQYANYDFVYQHVKNLRKKIATANGIPYLETVHGLGYKFNAFVTADKSTDYANS